MSGFLDQNFFVNSSEIGESDPHMDAESGTFGVQGSGAFLKADRRMSAQGGVLRVIPEPVLLDLYVAVVEPVAVVLPSSAQFVHIPVTIKPWPWYVRLWKWIVRLFGGKA